jgi:hypothetical protein
MFIKMKIGRYAGEIIDVQANCARRLLDSGQAEDPYAPPVQVTSSLTAAPVPSPSPVKTGVKAPEIRSPAASATNKAIGRQERGKKRRVR